MIVGFGFGSPLISIAMLLITSLISYTIFRFITKRNQRHNNSREELRAYYIAKRDQAREFSRQFDLTDEEIERRIDEQLSPRDHE